MTPSAQQPFDAQPLPPSSDSRERIAAAARKLQLRWPEAETKRIGLKVYQDYRNALTDHNRRIRRWREYFRRWRAMTDDPSVGEEDDSNFSVPYIRWEILAKLAKEMDALFGDDAQIVAIANGPSDFRRDAKIGRFMDWRVFKNMKLVNPFCEFLTRKLIFGRSFAYSGWTVKTYTARGKEKIKYRGPEFIPMAPDDVIVPAEEAKTIHDFSFVIRRVRIRPDELLDGEQRGLYQGISDNWEDIVNRAQMGMTRDVTAGAEEIKREQDDAESISYTRPISAGETLLMLEWYGRWRPLKSGKDDAQELDFKRRERRQKDYCIRFLPDLQLVVGIQALEDLYPDSSDRRPFVESSMLKDGSYWCAGIAEMLIDLEDELRANHNQNTEAAALAASPAIGYRPASGFEPKTFKLEPGMAFPLDNPATDLREIRITTDFSAATWKEQTVLAYGEKLTGMSDMQLGRQPDRPNAPKTGRQTIALLEEGNVRISLDTKVLREDMSAILGHLWELECQFTTDDTFFRVTEEDAGGLFDVDRAKGGAFMTEQDFTGEYDFSLKFANSVYSREAEKEKALARYQLDLQNPLIVNNPRALWQTTKEAHKALGDPNFADMVPEPPAPDMSINPAEEWARMQQGEEVHVNPMDNDQVHLIRHHEDYMHAVQDPDANPRAIQALKDHYTAHIMQLQQKKLQQAIIEQALQAGAQLMGGAGGGPVSMPGGLFGGPVSQPPGNPAAHEPAIYSGHPENLHGNS
jgi:hypothetical protein